MSTAANKKTAPKSKTPAKAAPEAEAKPQAGGLGLEGMGDLSALLAGPTAAANGGGCQAAEHFTGSGGLKKGGALPQHMAVHRIAQVGGDALTQPADHIEPRR